MRNDPVDVSGGQPRAFEHLVEHAGKIDHGVTKHLAAFHAQLADRAGGRGPAIDEQQIIVAAVGMELGRQDAAVGLLGAQHQRAGAVAEQHAGRAVVPVEQPAERLGADH